MLLSRLGSLPHWTCRKLCRGLQVNTTQSPKPFRVLFLGNDEFSCVALEQLHAAKDVWKRIDVVTYPDKEIRRKGLHTVVSPMKELAGALGLDVIHDPPERLEFRKWTPPAPYNTPAEDTVIVTASFGRILSSPLLNSFLPTRRLNIHPSLVPQYRGAAPIQHTILNEDPIGGVCIISMGPIKTMPLDAGDIWGRRIMPIPAEIAFPELRDALAVEGGALLVDVLRSMMSGTARSIPQRKDDSALHALRIEPIDGVLDLATMTASDIVTRSRAISHQRALSVQLEWNGKALHLDNPKIYTPPAPENMDPHWPMPSAPGTAIFNKAAKALLVKCAEETFLAVPQVTQQVRKPINAREWWNGVKDHLVVSAAGVPEVRFLSFEAAKEKLNL